MEKYLVLATFVGSIIALLFVVITAKKVLRFSEGTPLMQKISQSIRQGANAYLKRQYSVVGVFFACMVVVLCIMAACGLLTWFVPFAFLTGGFFSGLSGFIGMKIATASNCRTANACQEGLNRGLRVGIFMVLRIFIHKPTPELQISNSAPCPVARLQPVAAPSG